MVTPNRICPQCGTPLVPGEAFCSNCGTRYPEPSLIDPTQRAPASSQNPSHPSLPQIEPTQYAGPSPYGSSPYGNTAYGSGEQSYSPQPPNAGYAPPPPGVSYGGASEGYEQQSSMQPPGGYVQQRRRGPNVGLIVGVILLLLLLVGGGIYFLSRGKSNTTNGVGTATVTTRVGTPTPTAKPTPQPLFSDNFADNSKGWNTGSGSGFTSTIGNNALTLSEANHKILDEPIPGGSNTSATYTDFSVTTTFTI